MIYSLGMFGVKRILVMAILFALGVAASVYAFNWGRDFASNQVTASP